MKRCAFALVALMAFAASEGLAAFDLMIRPEPLGGGGRIVAPTNIYDIADLSKLPVRVRGTAVAIEAVPDAGYRFVQWRKLDTTSAQISPMARARATVFYFGAPTVTVDVVAEFVTIIPVPSLTVTSRNGKGDRIGEPQPFQGIGAVNYGQQLQCSVTSPWTYLADPNSRSVVTGWVGTGSVPANGSGDRTPQFIVSNDVSAITWRWVDQFKLTINVHGGGMVTRNPEKDWYNYGERVFLSAESLTEPFRTWSHTTSVLPTNTVVMTNSLNITAVFSTLLPDTDNDGMPDVWEELHGLDPYDGGLRSPHGANGDPDGDGLINKLEYDIYVYLSSNGIPNATLMSPVNADSDNDGMDDYYEFHHIGPVAVGTGATLTAWNYAAPVNDAGELGRGGNPDGDFLWDTDTGYDTSSAGGGGLALRNWEEYVGPDNRSPVFFVTNLLAGFRVPVRVLVTNDLAHNPVNPDTKDQSYSNSRDTDRDGFEDGFEYTWDRWQGMHAGEPVGDPAGHRVPFRFEDAALPMSAAFGYFGTNATQLALMVANSGHDRVVVLQPTGGGRFSAVQPRDEYRVGSQPTVLRSANFDLLVPPNPPANRFMNVDDAVVINSGTNLFTVFLKTLVGPGFQPLTTYTVLGRPICVAVGDLNTNGYTDIAVLSTNAGAGWLTVFLNSGAGTFTGLAPVPTGPDPTYVEIGNLRGPATNAAGVARRRLNDVVVTCAGDDSVYLYANDGFGVLSLGNTVPIKEKASGRRPTAVAFADLDQDNTNDMVVTCFDTSDVWSWHGNGDLTFTTPLRLFLNDNWGSKHVAIGQFDARRPNGPNRYWDAVVPNQLANNATALMGMRGDVGFFTGDIRLTGNEPVWVITANLDNSPGGQGIPDDYVVVCRGQDRVYVFLGQENGGFREAGSFDTSSRVADRRFHPNRQHVPGEDGGRGDYDIAYNPASGRSTSRWLTDQMEANAWAINFREFSPTFLGTVATNALGSINTNGIYGAAGRRRCTNPFRWDTDFDRMPDGWELAFGYDPWNANTDGDNLSDDNENEDGDWMAFARLEDGSIIKHYDVYLQFEFNPYTAHGYLEPYRGGARSAPFSNWEEMCGPRQVPALYPLDPDEQATHPLALDTDAGVGDGMWDSWEWYVGLNPLDPLDAGWGAIDDGLSNLEEFQSFATSSNILAGCKHLPDWWNKIQPTDPWDWDTDWDQWLDGWEKASFNAGRATVTVVTVYSPTNLAAVQHEYAQLGGLNPTTADTDVDYMPDAWEAMYPGVEDLAAPGGWSLGMNGTMDDAWQDWDNDGLLNYQEYWAGAVHHWQYVHNGYIQNMQIPIPFDDWLTQWTDGRGLFGYEPFDFFNPQLSNGGQWYEGPGGRGCKGWDPNYWADQLLGKRFDFMTGIPYYLLGVVLYSSTDPGDPDSDGDGMDDYWECHHGMNPVYGNLDLVWYKLTLRPVCPDAGLRWYPSMECNRWPWITGNPFMDPDQDELQSINESIQPVPYDEPYWNRPPYYHTDPTPHWMTDHSAPDSFVNLYYWTGLVFDDPLNPWWYWHPIVLHMNLDLAPDYVYDFECNEGFDTDHDFESDRAELVHHDHSPGVTDSLAGTSPIKRRAMYLNGDAALRTSGGMITFPWELRNWTTELWCRPSKSVTGQEQVLIERGALVPQGNPLGMTAGYRVNFSLGLDKDGRPFTRYNGAGDNIIFQEAKASPDAALVNGQWYHVTCTYNGDYQTDGHYVGMLKLFVDGELVAATPSSEIPFNGFHGLIRYDTNLALYVASGMVFPMAVTVGSRDTAGAALVYGSPITGPWVPGVPPQPVLSAPFYGWVDKVEIWDQARTQGEIKSTMRKRYTMAEVTAVSEPRIDGVPWCMGKWDFDDMSDPDHDYKRPYGFDMTIAYPPNYGGVYWWSMAQHRSRVYDDYRYVPWIDNLAMRRPMNPPVDSTIPLTAMQFYPNTANPYNLMYLTGTRLGLTGHPANRTAQPYVQEQPHYLDLLPLMWAVADEDVEMWDLGGKGTDPFDSDGDSLPDTWEEEFGFDPLSGSGANGAEADPDNDGLNNFYEYLTRSNPHSADSDGDGVPDRDEDFDKDGLHNAGENDLGTLPNNKDTDDDGVSDWEEVTGSTDSVFNTTRPKTSKPPRIMTDPLDPLAPGVKRCLWLDGNSRLIVPPSNKLMTENWTVELWVYPKAANLGGVLMSRFLQGTVDNISGINYEVGLTPEPGSPGKMRPYARFLTKDGVETRVNGLGGTEQTAGLAPILVPEEKWTHIAATYDMGTHTMCLYVNALLAAFRTDATDVPPTVFGFKRDHNGDEVTVGASRSQGPVANGFRGYVDEIRLWRTARSAEQIHDLYNGISVAIGRGEQTDGPTYDELTPQERTRVSAALAAAQEAAAASGGKYTVKYSPIMARNINELCGYRVNASTPYPKSPATFARTPNLRLPASFNWQDHNGVSPIKNQGGCGSCWAFGTVAAMESGILISDKVVEDLSEQFLVSCNTDGFGCGGGFPCFEYFVQKSAADGRVGAVFESDFPYAAADLPCGGPYNRPYTAKEWGWLGNGPGDLNIPDTVLKEAIYKYGPIPVAIYVGPAFQAYSGGIFNTDEISPTGYGNHCVVLIGWSDPGRYWVVKNSWGTGWGEAGFMRIGYGISGIGQGASYVKYGDTAGGTTIALELRFDDGGTTAQDFTEVADWMNDWGYAAVLGGSEFSTNTTPPLHKDTDGDGMPDWWEVANGLDPTVGEGEDGAYGDPDRDELNNIYEYRAGTAPRDRDTDNDGFVDYDSLADPQGNGRTFGEKYDDGDRIPDAWELKYMGVCLATGNRGLDPAYYDANLDPDEDGWSNYAEYMGYWMGAVNVTRSTDPLSATNYPMPFVGIHTRYYGLRGPDIDTVLAGGATLHFDFYSVASMDGYPVATLNGVTRSRFSTNRFDTGHLVEGTNFVFAYLDMDNNGIWNPTNEPAGYSEPHPVVGWGNVANVEIGLTDSRQGYPRLGWPVRNGVLGYKVKFMQGVSTVFERFIYNANRNYIHDWDFIVKGRLGLPNGSYNCQVYRAETVLGTVYTNLHSVSVVIVDRAIQANPTFVTGHGSTFVYAKNDLTWKMSTGATAYRVAVARTRGGAPIAGTVRTLPAPYRDRSGNYRAPLPFLAGDVNGDGTTAFDNGTYWLSMTSYGPGSTSPTNWIALNLSLTPPPEGGKSAISGKVYYFGKVAKQFGKTQADGLPIIVQSFMSAGFSGDPDAQVQTKYVCSSNPPAADPKFRYRLFGLHNGQHAIRAFIDLNGNRTLDAFEPYGFAREDVDNWDYAPRLVDLGEQGNVQVEDVNLVIRDRDTDDDGLPDGWEWMYYGHLDKGGDDLGANGLPLQSNYEIDPRDLDPTTTDYDGDGLTDLYEVTYSDLRTGRILGPTHYDPYHPILNPNGKDLNPAKADTDGDGLTDGYEISKGLDPLNPYGDADGDGVGDAAEVLVAGTDPTDSRDVLAVVRTGVNIAEDAFVMEWDGRPDVTYQVQSTTDLVRWQNAPNGLFRSAVRTTHRYTEQGVVNGRARFYRVIIP